MRASVAKPGAALRAFRRRQGWTLAGGTVLQAAVIATGAVVPAMYGLGAIFGALWLTAIWLGRRYQVP